MWEINIIMNLIKEFGLGLAEFGVIVFLLWKIATNHLRHISEDIKSISTDVKLVASDVQDIKENVAKDRERIAKLEGKLE